MQLIDGGVCIAQGRIYSVMLSFLENQRRQKLTVTGGIRKDFMEEVALEMIDSSKVK
jgi:hypothetical protein